ncbi:fasciclin domain containing protein [Acanthamoeba castellanii str. Neff]|uniref:Fasciclin domain containing protein n=1 Tax=Acanthamoeba castellanii (strain ATCC 30010 / Neff) TaxID=1257118 RepID=L8GT58_ACACF|nr:fasciclin domain containing protein [Acanthamoeba castellanii str. Neff]ELR16175.1 fasciclin domain containing protein [Acanthamoeba castellanii str. Neff]
MPLLLKYSVATLLGTILEVLRNQTRFSDLASSVDASALVRARLGNGSVDSTVFGPVDHKAPFNLTEPLLTYHLVDGRSPQAVELEQPAPAAQVSINGVRVQQADIAASNGAIHALESVLPLPGSLAKALDAFPTLKSLVAAANLTLPAASSTVFAPTEAAFASLKRQNPALLGYLTSAANGSQADLASLAWVPNRPADPLVADPLPDPLIMGRSAFLGGSMFGPTVLKYHVLGEVLYAQDIALGSQQANTLADQSVTITKAVVNNSVEVTLNSSSTSARVEAVNTLASDGVLHSINSVLVPNGFVFSLRKILVGLNDTTLLRLLDQANLTSCLTGITICSLAPAALAFSVNWRDPTEDCGYTIFAPSQEAWEKADESDYGRTTARLASVLKSHIYPAPLPALSQNMTLTMLSNKTVHIVNNTLTLEGDARLGSAHLLGSVTAGSNGYAYAIDQVLGVALASDDSLSKATIGWIIVGGMGGILLLAAVVVAVVWYVKRRRAEYEVINGSV